MNNLIFSDEPGRWNEGDYYVRSWISISPSDYELIRKDIIFIKHETGTKELKWNSIKNTVGRIKDSIESLFETDFNIFLTVSKPDHFINRIENDRYNILATLKKIEPEQSTGGESFTATIKDKGESIGR